jgi:hypothetical protein
MPRANSLITANSVSPRRGHRGSQGTGGATSWPRASGAQLVTCLGSALLSLACSGSISPSSDVTDGSSRTSDTAPGTSASNESPSDLSPRAARVARSSETGDPFRGGRLYDNFYTENPRIGFLPDDAASAAPDGEGGPLGDGTLRDGEGQVLDNALGHAYRMKNFFGWDLRGQDGVYGPQYQNKVYVAPFNLIGDDLTRERVAQLIVEGAAGVPAYGDVVPEDDLGDVVALIMAVREHELPRPDDIWELDASAPNGYVLSPGGSAAAGHLTISSSCSGCHGPDGTALLFDDGEFSLGSLARGNAYEVWFKIIAGNPGTIMDSQIPADETWATQAQMVLDVLAALCDQGEYPRGAATEPDVAAGDPHCANYLR